MIDDWNSWNPSMFYPGNSLRVKRRRFSEIVIFFVFCIQVSQRVPLFLQSATSLQKYTESKVCIYWAAVSGHAAFSRWIPTFSILSYLIRLCSCIKKAENKVERNILGHSKDEFIQKTEIFKNFLSNFNVLKIQKI